MFISLPIIRFYCSLLHVQVQQEVYPSRKPEMKHVFRFMTERWGWQSRRPLLLATVFLLVVLL